MNRRRWAHIVAVGAVAAAFAAVAPAAAAGEAAAGAEAAAAGYLQARAAAITAADPAAALAGWVVPGSALARTEAKFATGAALRGQSAGRTVVSATCRVTVIDSRSAAGQMVVVARAITLLTWRARSGATDVEGSGVDHTLTLARGADGWVVTADAYNDVLKAACLEAAGASRAAVRSAARGAERAGAALALPRLTATPRAIPERRYTDIISYDRPAAQDYADTYALSYNPTFASFAGADCANFASQCARAGDMPQSRGATTSGWWYDKGGTSAPWDDTYSLSWINCTRQIAYWNTRRTDWETSAGALSRGDFIYYDWSGDGVWDHVAVVAGSNSAGQRVIDAHTTDHYRVYWKLGYTGTKYRYAKVRPQWVV
jgi:cell wall-associated NlpC family hydrolase